MYSTVLHNMLRFIVISLLILGVLCALKDTRAQEKVYYTREFIEAEGYPAETHHVVTSDGYILELHRIPFGKNSSETTETRPVVFLMHGLLGASNSFIYLGPEYSIGYNVADAGYDVWMGNVRGTRNSRRHVTLDPEEDKKEFFNFTFEDVAVNDISAMIDYVLGYTGQQKLHYIGHSQGGTVFLVLNSLKTEYHAKIASAHLLAGVGYQKNFPTPRLKLIAEGLDAAYAALLLTGEVELFPPSADVANLILQKAYETALNFELPTELIGGASARQIVQYGQNVRDKEFRSWDYGGLVNIEKYGELSPPSYDLSKINIDVTLHYSLNDTLLSEADTLAMANTIPNCKARKVARESFSHIDYITSTDVKELVTDYLIEALNKY